MFQAIFLRPIFNLLVVVYNALPQPDLGIAVILLVVLLRVILWPLFQKAAQSQIMFAKIQPDVERIQKKYKEDRQEQTKQLLALYREHKFNPFSGMLVILVQIPLIIALYQVFLRGIGNDFSSLLYASVKNPGMLNAQFFGLIDLTKPFFPLVVVAALAQFWQSKTLPQPKSQDPKSFQAMFSRQMVYMGPILTVAIFSRFPAVVPLYWGVTSVVSVGQQYLVERKLKKQQLT